MTKIHYVFFVMLLALLCMDTSDARATMEGLSIDDLTRGADAVVKGTVEELVPRWSADGKKIITTAHVRVANVVRGKSNYRHKNGGLIQVEYEGGEIGDIGYKRADVSILSQGDEVFMFLKAQGLEPESASSKEKGKTEKAAASEDMPHTIVGLGQGVYKVDMSGMARKSEFSIASGHDKVNAFLHVKELTDLVKGVK